MKDKPVILVVDDQSQNIELLEAYLVPQGYEIVRAASGEEALGKLSGDQIDLMLLDVMMPGIDGFEVTRRVRQDNTHRLLPIILVTSLRETEDRIKGIEAGCDDFISKPFDKMELLARVRSLLKVKDYNDLISNYRQELESEVVSRTGELKHALENLQQEITERKQAEEALRESEEKYRGLVENISDVIYGLDSQFKVIYISPVIRDILGYDAAEIVGKNLSEFVHKDDLSSLSERFSELRKGIESPSDYRFINKSGELRWVRTKNRPIVGNGLFKGARGTLTDITDQRRLEEELRESAEKYQRFFMTSRDCVFITSKEGSWIDMNDASVELFGYSSREELMQVKIPDLYVNPEERTKHSSIISKCGYTKEYPMDLRRKDGTVMHTLITSIALCDAKNNVIGFQGTIRDITEHKRIERSLLENEARLRTLVQTIPDLIWLKDADGIYLACNTRFERFFGAKEADIVGKTDYDFVDKEMADFFREHDRKAMAAGKSSANEEWLTFADDGYRGLFDTIKTPVYDAEGKLIGVLGIARDITERKQAEEALRKSEEKYRNIFENATEGIYQATPEGRFITVNAAFTRMAGYDSPEDFIESIGKIGPHLFVHPEDRKSFSEIMAKSGIVEGFEVEFYQNDGSMFWVVVNSRVVKDKQGKIIYYEGIVEDITLRKQAEGKLLQTLDKLRKAFSATIQVLVSAVESRDPYTAGHQIRSADLARAIATEMGLSQEIIDGIRMAGAIHDIGKLSVPAELLSKPTKLSELEFSLVKEHANKGFEMLKDVESPWPLAEIVYQHHERMNGSGYPRHLKGEEIITEARILAVADVVEAIASHRPYRPAIGLDAALAEIENNSGTLYDAEAVDACLRLFREKGFQLEGT